MTRHGALVAALAFASCGAAAAQDRDGRAHLDDFAIAPAEDVDVSAVDQLGERDTILEGSAQPESHDLRVASAGTSTPGPVSQLTTEERGTQGGQLSDGEPSREVAPLAVSNSADSRPQGVIRVGGTDRCDPQLAEDDAARCREILELRAAEFQAAEPPRMSAEQVLLAQQGEDESAMTLRSLDRRLQTVGRNPDPETRSNQELASLIFDQGPATAPTTPAAPETAVDEMAELLESLQVDLGAFPQD